LEMASSSCSRDPLPADKTPSGTHQKHPFGDWKEAFPTISQSMEEPSTDVIHIKVGRSVKLRVIGTSNNFIHPRHGHGGPFTVMHAMA
jgi:hypothetical protein